MPTRTPTSSLTYQLKITIKGIRPPIWRRVRVPGRMNLLELHDVIQVVFGWTTTHLHKFVIGGTHYNLPDEFDGMEGVDERKVTLAKVVRKGTKRFLYVYDFGDDWRHEVVVERVEPAARGEDLPVCLAGKRQRPPEDCGGPLGYAGFLKVIREPSQKELEAMLDWVGGSFNPEAFDLEAVNEDLS
jgi:hypothetical protein